MTGLIIGNYRIVDRLGHGGQGKVYRAIDTMVEREVAIKALRPEIAHEPETLERFRTEAVTLAKLNHPAIAQLYTFFRDGDDFYMVMEYVPGRTLETIIRDKGPAPWQRAVTIAASILDAVGFAHGLGILHRDIKPANIMLTADGRVKVMDFGIAQVLGGPKMTRAGTVIGTLEYLAPERIRGSPPDLRADLYSVGIVLYEMLTGRLPFQASTDYAMMMAQLNQPAPPPKELGIDLPDGVVSALMTALEKDADRRFPDAATFAASLRSLAPPTPEGAPITGAPAKTAAPKTQPAVEAHPQWWQNRRIQWMAAAVAAFLFLLAVSLAVFGVKEEDPWKEARSLSLPEPAASGEAQVPTSAPPAFQFDPTPIPMPGARTAEDLPPVAAEPVKPPAPEPRREPTPPQQAKGLEPEKRKAVAAALERTDGPAGGAPGAHPIHLVGLLGALAAGGRVASPDIQQVVTARGVNFQLSPAISETLRDAGASPGLLRVVGERYRPPAPSEVAAAPVEPVPPKEPAPRPVPAISSIGDVRRLFIEPAEGELDAHIRAELQEKLGDRIRSAPSASEADAVMKVQIEQLKGGSLSKAGRLFGLSDKRRVQARVVAASNGRVLWDEKAGDRNLMTGPFSGDGARRLAARIVSALEEDLR